MSTIHLPTSPQYQANYIIDKLTEFRNLSEELCKDRSVRLEERLYLVNYFGIQTKTYPLTFNYFKVGDDSPFKVKIEQVFNKLKTQLADYNEGTISDIAAELSDKFHLMLYDTLAKNGQNEDEVIQICVDMEIALKDAVLEEFLQKFISYVYSE